MATRRVYQGPQYLLWVILQAICRVSISCIQQTNKTLAFFDQVLHASLYERNLLVVILYLFWNSLQILIAEVVTSYIHFSVYCGSIHFKLQILYKLNDKKLEEIFSASERVFGVWSCLVE
jgi:hypothetical protein